MYQLRGAVIFIPEERVGLVRRAARWENQICCLVLSMSLARFEVFRIPKASDTPMFKCKDEEMVRSHQ